MLWDFTTQATAQGLVTNVPCWELHMEKGPKASEWKTAAEGEKQNWPLAGAWKRFRESWRLPWQEGFWLILSDLQGAELSAGCPHLFNVSTGGPLATSNTFLLVTYSIASKFWIPGVSINHHCKVNKPEGGNTRNLWAFASHKLFWTKHYSATSAWFCHFPTCPACPAQIAGRTCRS